MYIYTFHIPRIYSTNLGSYVTKTLQQLQARFTLPTRLRNTIFYNSPNLFRLNCVLQSERRRRTHSDNGLSQNLDGNRVAECLSLTMLRRILCSHFLSGYLLTQAIPPAYTQYIASVCLSSSPTGPERKTCRRRFGRPSTPIQQKLYICARIYVLLRIIMYLFVHKVFNTLIQHYAKKRRI